MEEGQGEEGSPVQGRVPALAAGGGRHHGHHHDSHGRRTVEERLEGYLSSDDDGDGSDLDDVDEFNTADGLRLAKERALMRVLHDYDQDYKGRRIPGTERLCDLMVSSERLAQIGGITTGLYFMWHEQEMVLFALISVICVVGLIIAGRDQCGFCHYKWYGDDAEIAACEAACDARPDSVYENGRYSAWVIEMSIAKNVYAVSPIWLDAAYTIIIGAWIIYIGYFRAKKRDDLDSTEITVGDYSVMVVPNIWSLQGGLSQDMESNPSDVAHYFSHYGEVTGCVVVHDIGEVIVADARLAQYRQRAFELLLQKHMAEGDLEEGTSTPVPGSPSPRRARRALSHSDSLTTEELGSQLKAEPVSVVKNPLGSMRDRQLAKYHARILDVEKDIERIKEKNSIVNSGYAFITFNHEDQRRACLEDHDRSDKPFFKDPKDPQGRSIQLNVEEPPEPSDVYFEHLSDQGIGHYKRQWAVNLIALGLLVVGGIIQLVFITIKDTLNENSGEDTNAKVYVQLISVLSAAVVALIDVVLLELFKKLSEKEMHHTRSALESSMIWRQTTSQLANTTLIPIVTSAWRLNFDSSYDYSKWFIAGGLVEQMLYVQILNVFSQHIYTLSQIELRLAEMFLVKRAASQERLDQLMRFPPFAMAYQYSYILKTVGMALFLGPVLPISYIITFVALVATYFVDRYTLLRIRERPLSLDESVGETVITVLKALILARCFVAYFFWYRVPANSTQDGPLVSRDHFQAFLVCSIFSFVAILAGNIVVKIYRENFADDDQGTGGLTFHECERLNSETKGHFRALENYTPFVTLSHLPSHLGRIYGDSNRSWKPSEFPMEGQLPGTHPSERPKPPVADLKAILKQSKLDRMMNRFIERLRTGIRQRRRQSTDEGSRVGSPGGRRKSTDSLKGASPKAPSDRV